jgi:Fe-S oxidoreductase
LGIDVRDFIKKLRTGLPGAAYKIFANFAVLPGIACHICDEPCRGACVRNGVDSPVSLRSLERFCWNASRKKKGESHFIPEKKKRILVVGGGLCGISCAVKLAQRGYCVRLAEKSARLGGSLDVSSEVLRGVAEEEFAWLSGLRFLTVALNEEVTGQEGLEYDAVVVATGRNGSGIGKMLGWGMPAPRGVFFSGTAEDGSNEALRAIRRGSMLSYAIEDFVNRDKVASVSYSAKESRFVPERSKIVPAVGPDPSEADNWSLRDAKAEASRCVLCSCSNCADVCEMLAWFHRDAKGFMVSVSDTVNKIKWNKRTAIRPAMSCTQCGSCKASCPVGIDLKALCSETRRYLSRRNLLPSGYYDYWMNDMKHAEGEEAALFIPQTGERCEYVYFPGCQMGASDPDYVVKSYEWLAGAFDGRVALMLGCCGAPAYWAAEESLHGEAIARVKKAFLDLGEPKFILSCPTCSDMLKNYLQEVETVSLWGLMADSFPRKTKTQGIVSVFDPCSSKYDPKTQNDVRTLIRKCGYEISELAPSGGFARCCGYGGLVFSSNPDMVERIMQHNISMGNLEFVTYCTNCRDSFAGGGKESRHLLDLLFSDDPFRSRRVPPSLSDRRKNRLALKRILSGKYGVKTDTAGEADAFGKLRLIVTDEVRKKLDRRLILDENLRMVIHHAAMSGKNDYFEDEDFYAAHKKQGGVTFWVHYRPTEDGYMVLNAYLHRLHIEEDEPWRTEN